MPQVVLGVDGGNTKTDYLLFDLAGNFIDGIRLGTCSHEGLPDGFDGAYRVMKESINQLLKRNNLKISDVHSAAFRLPEWICRVRKSGWKELLPKSGLSICGQQ